MLDWLVEFRASLGLVERLRELRESLGRSTEVVFTRMEADSLSLPRVGEIEMLPCKEGGQETRERLGGPVIG